ncbi:MAG: efflux RND transporter permease subunit, partial [Leptospiraceae bacterium]|nr:efflux RND transporter permease subunit [Leptospiraceae bacterium]
LEREYLIEANPFALKNYHVDLNTLIYTVSNRNYDMPGGSLKIDKNEYVLRTKGLYQNTKEIQDTVIRANDLAFTTRIKDLARVSDTFEERKIYERFKGKEAIIFSIWKKKSADEISTSERIKEKVSKFNYNLNSCKDCVAIELFDDRSENTKNDISSVISNAISGFFLLFLVLLVSMGFRMSVLVTLCIPLSFMIAFWGMDLASLTLNVVSLFGLIMVLGMIVDFGIVVSENTHRYLGMGFKKQDAIEKGVSEVVWPVTVTLLCICAAFAPLLMVSGIIGKFVKAIPIVLMVCLGASWIIAIFVLPTYLSIFSKSNIKNSETGDKPSEEIEFEKGWFGKLQFIYKISLELSLKFRYLTFGGLVALFVAALSLTPLIGFVFISGGGEKGIVIKTKLPQQRNLEENLKQVKELEKIILRLPKEELVSLRSRVGIEANSVLDPKPGEGTHKSTLNILLSPESKRKRLATEIRDALRKEIQIATEKGILAKEFNVNVELQAGGPPVGKPINIELRGKDFSTLEKIAKEYMDYLKTLKGVINVEMDFEPGKQEYRYHINEVESARANLSVVDVARSLYAAFKGAEATTIWQGEDEIKVRVRFPEDHLKQKNSLNEVLIANRNGGLVPLSTVTYIQERDGYSQINRLNYKRIIQVQADVKIDITNSMKVNSLLKEKFKDIHKRYPGYFIAYGGENEDTNKTMSELGILFIYALIIIFIILAVFFDSLILPLVVMGAIPFSLVGVIFALYTHSQPLSFMSVLGLFSLAGVIVSNTLVLVQFINNIREETPDLRRALIRGGVIRLKPVFLTTGTTVLGLIPTIYAIGGNKNYFVAPLALAFGYGLIFASFITLILIPCLYYMAEDMKFLSSRVLEKIGIRMDPRIYIPQKEKNKQADL